LTTHTALEIVFNRTVSRRFIYRGARSFRQRRTTQIRVQQHPRRINHWSNTSLTLATRTCLHSLYRFRKQQFRVIAIRLEEFPISANRRTDLRCDRARDIRQSFDTN
jgi:hypothetical protein